ncbi:MAG: DUF3795 domain-containing protein [Desulfarculaceae bacterium]|nr:DUF3795 domain-containing protein [Desulfarculaceae bacterium]MCF8123000.1 DUF3795 domain-containing protein [Desulfarculaceae bacterium]
MDYHHMTAPCGLDCFNCFFYLATQGDEEALSQTKIYHELMGIPEEVMRCNGCRAHEGNPPMHEASMDREGACPAYACTTKKGLDFCCDCDEFPCDYLHPWADRADKLPHNIKVFNLCLIKRMGLEKWATEKAAEVRQTYFHKWWTLT